MKRTILFILLFWYQNVFADYWPEMWEGLEYDSVITVDQLQKNGWQCSGISKNPEGFDGQCGPYATPRISIFGVQIASSSVFLRGRKSATVNIGLHETAQEYVLENLAHALGAPTGVELHGNNCVIEWLIGTRQYTFYVTDLRGAYARLYIIFPHLIDNDLSIKGVEKHGQAPTKLCAKYVSIAQEEQRQQFEPKEESVPETYQQSATRAVMRHMRYPRVAVMRNWQGTTVVEIELSVDGEVIQVVVAESSGYKVLDDAALKMVRGSLPLPEPPHGVRTLTVPVAFRL